MMKRQIYPNTAAAISWWAANPDAIKADCFTVALPTGQTLYATDGQWDLTIPAGLSPTGAGLTFYAYQYGAWSRGAITSEAGFRCQSNSMRLTLVPKLGATYPGLGVSLLSAVFNHLFDGAQVWAYTAWMPLGQYGHVQVVETKFQGRIAKTPQLDRLQVQFDVADPFFLLNQKVPSRLIQSNCFKSFADSNCGLNPANYTVTFTAKAGSTQTQLTPVTALTQPDGYFTQGVVRCLTGQNAGLSQTVKFYVGGVIAVTVPWFLPVAPGDAFSVIKGCDQTPATCAGTKYANGTAEPGDWRMRFGGMPYVPPPASGL
jgi:uncharacterized phage protein (TIGR02218 family)